MRVDPSAAASVSAKPAQKRRKKDRLRIDKDAMGLRTRVVFDEEGNATAGLALLGRDEGAFATADERFAHVRARLRAGDVQDKAALKERLKERRQKRKRREREEEEDAAVAVLGGGASDEEGRWEEEDGGDAAETRRPGAPRPRADAPRPRADAPRMSAMSLEEQEALALRMIG